MATKKPAKKKPTAKKPAKKVAKKAPAKKAVKKAAPKKALAKKSAKKTATTPKVETPIGRVTHYFDQLKVAVISLSEGGKLKVGDSVRIEGGELDYVQKIESLQVEHESVQSVTSGDDFGTKVKKKVHEGYRVYKA